MRVNYNGVPIPSPDTRPDLTKPVIYWTPVIAPGNLTFYNGAMFPQWKGSALIGGMATQTINRITFDGKGGATPAERWDVGHRIRDVAVASGRRGLAARGRQSRRAVPGHAEVNPTKLRIDLSAAPGQRQVTASHPSTQDSWMRPQRARRPPYGHLVIDSR